MRRSKNKNCLGYYTLRGIILILGLIFVFNGDVLNDSGYSSGVSSSFL